MPRLFLLFILTVMDSVATSAEVVYVSSFGTNEVFRFDATTGALIDTFIGASEGGLNQPHGVLDRGADVLVSSAVSDQVLRYDRQTGDLLGELIGPASGLNYPVSLMEGPDGNLYVASQQSGEVLRYHPETGALIDAFVTAGSGGLSGPSGMAFGPDGLFYVAGRFSGTVVAYDGTTGAFDHVVANSSDGLASGSTFGLAFGANGDLYFASNSTLFQYDLTTEAIVATAGTGFPIGVEANPNDPNGGVVVATGNNLRAMDGSSGTLGTPLLGPGATISTLNFFHFSPFATADLPGDYNNDGTVDAADYTAWRDAFESGGLLANDVTPGETTAGDYQVWADHFSETNPMSTATSKTIPEPATALLVVAVLATISIVSRQDGVSGNRL